MTTFENIVIGFLCSISALLIMVYIELLKIRYGKEDNNDR